MGATWRVNKGGAGSRKSGGAKQKPLPHFKAIPITKDMAEGTKAFAEQYNEMRELLLAQGLMKSK